MPTNEERREVARKLRECSKAKVVYYPISNLFAATGTADELILFDRLADMIEPEPERTGHAVEDVSVGRYVSWRCSECEQPINKADNYCPNCGAKLVE